MEAICYSVPTSAVPANEQNFRSISQKLDDYFADATVYVQTDGHAKIVTLIIYSVSDVSLWVLQTS